jgi:N-acetylglucosaminyldiphosphoundecaprenol N-acetyl-beta-D-mannosaminyltransferase
MLPGKPAMDGRVSLLGTGVNAVDLESTLATIERQIQNSASGYICLAPAHNLMACRADARLQLVFNRSSLTVPDGMGTVWFLRLLGHRAGRVYGPDLMLAASQRGTKRRWRHFFLGGTNEVQHRLKIRLQKDNPNLLITGSYSPPFGNLGLGDERAMIQAINSSQADILWVALGSPRQELWMAEHRDKLKPTVLIGVGAAFDFLSGAKPQAPAWVQRAGLEWLFRLISEPRRLWRRYSAYPLFAALAIGQWLRITHYPLNEAG